MSVPQRGGERSAIIRSSSMLWEIFHYWFPGGSSRRRALIDCAPCLNLGFDRQAGIGVACDKSNSRRGKAAPRPKRRSRGFLECLADAARDRLGAFRRRLPPERGQLFGLLG